MRVLSERLERMPLFIAMRPAMYLADLQAVLIIECPVTLLPSLGQGRNHRIRNISLQGSRMFPLRPVVCDHNGLWCAEAEAYLLENAPKI